MFCEKGFNRLNQNIETAMLFSFVRRDLLTQHLQVIFAELTLAIPPSTPLLTRAPISITEIIELEDLSFFGKHNNCQKNNSTFNQSPHLDHWKLNGT